MSTLLLTFKTTIKDTQKPEGWNNLTWNPFISIEFMAAHGIRTVIFSVSTSSVDVMSPAQTIPIARACNEYDAQLRDSDLTRFDFFAMVPDPLGHPDAALAEIAHSLDTLHADDVCLLTRYGSGNVYLGHEEYRAIWDALDARKAVILIHPSQPAGAEPVNAALPAPVVDYPHETTRMALDMVTSGMLASHPNCRIILSHAGGTLLYLALSAAAILPLILKGMSRSSKTTAQIWTS